MLNNHFATMVSRLWSVFLTLQFFVTLSRSQSLTNPSAKITTEFRRNAILMLNDLVRHESVPTNIFLLACWTPSENVAFLKTFDGLATVMRPEKNEAGGPKLPADIFENLVMFVMDTSCGWDLAKVNSSYFGFPYRWLVLSSESSVDNQMWENVPIWVDSHLTLATWDKESKSFGLEELFKLGLSFNEVIREPFGSWSSLLSNNRLTDLRETRILSRRRRNLQMIPLQASVVILDNDTINHLWDYKFSHADTMAANNFLLVNALMDTINVTHRFKWADTWGYVDPETKKINGMLGDLLSGESVIGGTSLYMVEYRVGLFDYVSMINPTDTQFIFRAPPLSYVANIYYLPFEGMVWLCSGGLVVVACIAIYVAYWRSQKNGSSVDSEKVRGTDVLLLGVGAIAQMGSQLEAKFLSTKISTIFFFIFLLFMYTSYTANIVSLLQATTKSIRTLEDLYKSRLDYGVHDNPYNRWYFANTVGKLRQDIYRNKIAPPNKPDKFVNFTYGVEQMRKGFYAFHVEPGAAYKLVEKTFYEHEKCGIIQIDYLGTSSPWTVIEKRSKFKEIIKINLFKIREHGIQLREHLKIYTKKPICAAGGQSFQSVRLVDCYIVLQVLGCGFAGAVFVFIMEVLIHKRAKQCGAVCLF